MTEENKVELLAPAGSPESLDAAIGEGADAVYLGLRDFNARMRSANFTYSQFEAALRGLRRAGKKLYVTVNTVFEQREADRMYQLLKYLAGAGVDGIIVQDFGVITMAREHFPSLKLLASTQMNVSSARGVNLLSRHGFSRVILSRELSLAEIRGIRENTNMELEVFVHGALCVSVSGVCLFSSYLGGKSANRGMCTQACRRFYTAHGGKETEAGKGGYYFSPGDLELIEQIPALVGSGVNSFKIEGRMKSAEYVGNVVSAYRLVIDSIDSGEENLARAVRDARSILKNDFARPKTSYLINGLSGVSSDGGESASGIDWLNPEQSGGTGIPLGALLRVSPKTGRGLIPKGLIVPSVGDSVRLHRADDSDRVSHKLRAVEEGPDGASWISVPEGFGAGDSVYLIQTKAMTKRYAPVIPRKDGGTSREPGRDRAPLPKALDKNGENARGKGKSAVKENTRGRKRQSAQADFPPGIYVMVSRPEDLYVLQSSRPVKAILPCTPKNAKRLAAGGGKGLPFSPADIVLFLDPFFPQEDGEALAEQIPELMEKGYTRFIVNNLGHFSLFRQKDESSPPVLAAGPWLYTFNAWAWNFISRCGAGYCVSPLENSRQNLEKTFPGEDSGRRNQVFVTVLCRPGLFRIRQNLGAVYNFENFLGGRDEAFRLVSAPEGSCVYPAEYFSIVDKLPFLKKAGFSRFILDLSSGPLKKAEYRDIMEAVNSAAPLPGASRFNWKNGFFREPAAPEKRIPRN